ncbi:MAG: bifunctional hydroxymethylpyrimidine kinase/phosphomethylpyrimidine kinase [Methanothrix sp.]|nr:bifunctional hydroxymethylpyrimidine kinase/phosphomethylpyrimidine kinase [Methanothrix sp.]
MTSVVLTIGGSDSGGGAGIQADIKTFSVLGLHGTSALTAITAQNTLGVQQVFGLGSDVVRAQLQSITDDFPVAAAKTGMLYSAEIVAVVADHLRDKDILLVVDPVIEAEAGGRLLRPEATSALKDLLLPLAHVVTPNIFEAEALSGIAVGDKESAILAAREILDAGAGAVIVKGGHLDCTDLLATRDMSLFLPGRRVAGENHGVGWGQEICRICSFRQHAGGKGRGAGGPGGPSPSRGETLSGSVQCPGCPGLSLIVGPHPNDAARRGL